MAKITIFLLTTCAFGYLLCSESTTATSKKSEASSESSDTAEKDTDRRVVYAEAVSGHQQRPRPLQSPLLVQCHVCTDCPKVNEDTPTKLCPHSLDPNKRGKCVMYAEKYKHMHRPWYIRGCASERGSCEDIRRAHENHGEMVSLLLCNECEGDRCNRNGASTFADCTIAFIALIITPYITKFTLS